MTFYMVYFAALRCLHIVWSTDRMHREGDTERTGVQG